MTTNIDEMLADLRTGHSETQIDWFMLEASGITLWGAYQQALKEMRRRRANLISDGFAVRRAEIRILKAREASKLANDAKDRLAAMQAQLDLDEAETTRDALRDTQRETERELRHVTERAVELRARILADGPLTPNRVRRLDEDHWYAVVRRRVGMEFAANDRVEGSTLALFAGMPVQLRQRLAAALAPDMRAALVAETLTSAGPLAALPGASTC